MPLITSEKQLEKIWEEMPERFGFAENVETFWRKYKCWPEHYSCKRVLNKIHSVLWQIGMNWDGVKTFRSTTTRIIAIPWTVSVGDIMRISGYKDLAVWLDNKWRIELFPASEINTYFSPFAIESNPDLCTMVLTEIPQKRRK